MTLIQIRYVGPDDAEIETRYSAGVEFKRGEVAEVPENGALLLLQRRPESFKKVRAKAKTVEVEPPPVVEPVPVVETKRYVEEEPDLPPLVHLGAMTKEAIASYTHRYFGVVMDSGITKEAMIDRTRSLMGGAPRSGY